MDYQREHDILRNKVVDNFEQSLDEYIATDISEAGEVDYLITEIDEYYFCVTLEQELKFLIDDLINTSEKELLIKFTGLKRILNERLISNKYFNDDDFYNENLESTTSILSYIKLHPNIHNSKSLLQSLFDSLTKDEYINCSKNDFIKLFNESNNRDKVVWLKTINEILGLLNQLKITKVISSTNPSISKLAFNFFKTSNSDFNIRSLEVKQSDINQENVSLKYQNLTEIVNNLVKLS